MTIQKVNTSRNTATRSTYVGEKGRLFYDEANGTLYISDGRTPGGSSIFNKLVNGNYSATLDASGNFTVSGATSLSTTTIASSSNTTVTKIYRTGGGANYTSLPTITISAPTASNGVQATASLLYILNVGIYSIAAAGSGYTVGDTVTMTGGTLYGASPAGTFKVATINGSGGVTGLNTPNYTAYSVLPTNPTTFSGGSGTGLQANVTYAVQGDSFNITNSGSGYITIPTVTFSGGGTTPTPTQATAIAIIGNSNSLIQTPNAGLSFSTASGENLRILDQSPIFTYNQNSPQNTNFISLWGNQTGIEPVIRSYGTSDANVNLQLATSGTGNINFFTNYTNANGNYFARQQFQIASTANAANYLQVTGSITGNNPILSVQGTDATRSLQLTSKGTTFVYLQNNNGTVTHFSAGGTSSAVNYLNSRGYPTGSSPALEAVGNDSTIGLTLQMKGAGILQVNSGGMNLLKSSQAFNNVAWNGSSATRTDNNATAPDNTTTATLVQATAALYGGLVRQYMSAPYLYASYATYTMSFYAKAGTWNYVGLRMSGGQSGASDAYPYFNLSNGVATNITPTTGTTFNVGMTNAGNGWYRCYASYTTASVANSITDVAIVTSAGLTSFTPAGTETVYIWGAQVEFGSVMNTYLVTTLTTPVYNTPSIGFSNSSGLNLGMQSDGSLYFMNGGYEGALQAHATTNGLPAGGNARGLGAVDWQMRRGSASNVASGQESVIGGGYGNTVSGIQSVVAGGAANTNSGGSSFIGAGVGNSTSGLSSMVLAGGGYNTTNSYYSFIGGGSYNTAGVNSAATTQTTTALGVVATSTTVTLSATNATIRVGMMVFGGGVNYPNYVTAISGTTLTILTAATVSSSTAVTLNFFETHNVVIGGSNNRSTGVLSFVGGGGSADNSANGNLASGDWSFVGGGIGNQATALGAVVTGGGWFAQGSAFANIASGISSYIGGGSGNQAQGQYSGIISGYGNIASNIGSMIISGFQNNSTGVYATVIGGYQVNTRGLYGNVSFGSRATYISGSGSGAGVSQSSMVVLSGLTTTATPQELVSDSSNGAPSASNIPVLPIPAASTSSVYTFRGLLSAKNTATTDVAGWEIKGVIQRTGSATSTVALVGTPTVTLLAATAGAISAGWGTAGSVAVVADTTYGGIGVRVTGVASTSINWNCRLETIELV